MDMGGAGSLKALPIHSHPRHSVVVVAARILSCMERTEAALSPPFWRRLLGGVSRDHARSVAAACRTDVRLVRAAVKEIVEVLSRKSAEGGDRFSGLKGYCEKVLFLLDRWRDYATRFEENEYMADERLLETTRSLQTICSSMREGRSELEVTF